MTRTIFVSGHLDLTPEEFQEHYAPKLLEAAQDPAVEFVVGDAAGADRQAQELLSRTVPPDRVRVFHMLERPRNLGILAPTVGGFKTDEERDFAMTKASTEDLAWVRPGPGKRARGTLRNLHRRQNLAKELRDEERRSWSRHEVLMIEVYPVYNLLEAKAGKGTPIPPKLYERYLAVMKEYHEVQGEIEAALREQEGDPV